MTTQLFPYANRIILYAHCNLWPRVALAVSRLDTPMCLITSVQIYWLFLWSPFIAPWHRAPAGAGAVRLAGELGEGQTRAGLPAARASQGSAVIAACPRFPLSAATILLSLGSGAHAVFRCKGVSTSFYFSCRRRDFSGDLGV